MEDLGVFEADEGFCRISGRVEHCDLSRKQRREQERQEVATLDMDATLVETQKEETLYSYKGFKSYHPLNVWWAEQGVVLHTSL